MVVVGRRGGGGGRGVGDIMFMISGRLLRVVRARWGSGMGGLILILRVGFLGENADGLAGRLLLL